MATSSPENGSDELAPETSVTDSGVSMPVDSTASNVVTDKMIEEEERYTGEVNNRVTASLQEHAFSKMHSSQRYSRLEHLLNKSGIYSKILLKKMEDQREENRKQLLKKRPRRKRKGKVVDSKKGKGVLNDKESKDEKSVPIPTTRGRGRKRKAKDMTGYQLSEFMDSKGKLRKQPKLDNPSTVSSEKNVQMKDNNDTNDTEIEERYFEGVPIPIGQPKLFSGGIMRQYQLEGTEWLKVLYENGVNGILADEMGLGKTVQCIALIAHLIEMGVKGPYLVVAPLSTVPNWVAEFKRFTPEIPVVLYHGSIDERDSLRRKIFSRRNIASSSLLPVFVTSYEIVMRDHKTLCNREWKLMIVDEGHRIKNLNCLLIKMLKLYDAGNRLLLTGTPLQNNLAELWSLLNFILPDIFDDLDNFQSWFDFGAVVDSSECISANEKEAHILSTLHEILTPFLLRRLKLDVELNIPPKKEILVYAPLTPLQQQYYTGILNKTIEQLLSAQKKEASREWEGVKEKENVMEDVKPVRRRSQVVKLIDDNQFETMLKEGIDSQDVLELVEPNKSQTKSSVSRLKMACVWVMLRKCCNHPYLVDFPMLENGDLKIDQELVTSCGKMLLLDQMLTALLARGHKVLIFSQMTQLLDLIEDFMDLKELRYARLDGSTKFHERVTEMMRFKESPDCNVFLLSTRAGGLGINLTAADTVIIYDSDWNPQADLQAQDRCHRIGQTKPVVIYRFVTANTIDQRVVERAAAKRRLEKMVIHKDKFKGYNSKADTAISLDDLMDLLKSVDHDNVVNTQQILSDSALEAILDRNFASKDTISNGVATANQSKLVVNGVDNHYEFEVVEQLRDSENTLKGINSEALEK